MKKQRFFRRALAIAVLATLASANAFGLSTKYYYQTTVQSTGNGTVYASVNNTTPAESSYQTQYSTPVVTDSVIYLFAKPATGYAFDHWTDAATSQQYTGNPQRYSYLEQNTSSDNPATHTFIASFVEAKVTVKSEDVTKGTVRISSVGNSLNDSVALYADHANNFFTGTQFTGWYKNGVQVSTANPYTIASIQESDAGEYVAHFSRTNGYFRVRSQYTNKYLSLVGTSYRQATSSSDGFTGVVFDGSVKMTPQSQLDQTDPGFIVRIEGTSVEGSDSILNDIEVYCQGVTLRDSIIAKSYNGVEINARTTDDHYFTFSYYYNFNDRYLKDGTNYGFNWALACGGASDHKWILEPVTQIPITPSIEDGFSYATSMYTSFPYECGTGVSAWYSTGIEDDLIEVEDGHVPANTAVILRCDGEEGDFYIKPSFEEYDALEDNILEGYICLNGDSLSSAGKLVYAGGETWSSYDGAYLPSNRAFVTVSQNARSFNNTTAIKNLHSNNINNREVFDISGRKLNVDSGALRKGVYIVNGKKRVIK